MFCLFEFLWSDAGHVLSNSDQPLQKAVVRPSLFKTGGRIHVARMSPVELRQWSGETTLSSCKGLGQPTGRMVT